MTDSHSPCSADICDAAVDRAMTSFQQAVNSMVSCKRCNGTGYHHGFGEHGHDPDWCEVCGGCQSVPEFNDREAMREALKAAMPVVAQTVSMPQLVEVTIKRMETLADTALDGRAYEKECQEQMRLACNLLRQAYAAQPPAAPVETAIMEATEAQHTLPRQEGRPAQFTRNGKLETCQCGDCRRLSRSSAATEHERQHDHRVYFMCECCQEHDPENGVSDRSDIGVMPDGTWLCDNCYSDCDKTAYGMVPCDVDDFEFPRFEDLPRPAPYPVQHATPNEPQAVEVTHAAQFLLDRLDEFDPGEDEPEREYHGHVAPAIARLRAALNREMIEQGICPHCGGDCSAANPPVYDCPMQGCGK